MELNSIYIRYGDHIEWYLSEITNYSVGIDFRSMKNDRLQHWVTLSIL